MGHTDTRLVAAGLNFQTAPLAVRERAAIPDADAASLLQYLVGPAGLSGAVVLSTCNRTEFYLSCPTDAAEEAVVPRLARYLDPGNASLGDHLVAWRGEAAVVHLFRVAAGLESMVLGEAQVLGQVKNAHRIAQAAGTLDPSLDLVLRRAIGAGKLVRSDTGVGRGASSLSEVAARAATRWRGGCLEGCGVLVVGAGSMGRLVARRFSEAGGPVWVTSRSDSAESLAEELGIDSVRRDNVAAIIGGVDVVVSCTSSSAPVIGGRDVALWQAERGGRGLLLIDMAVPRDVDPAAGEIEGVSLIDVDSLGRIVDQSLEGRLRAVPEATRLIDEAVARTLRELSQRRGAGPMIAELVGEAEQIRQAEMARLMSRLGSADADAVAAIERMTRSLVSRLLHGPIEYLRDRTDTAGELVGRSVTAPTEHPLPR